MKSFQILTLSTLLLVSILLACNTAAPAEISESGPQASSPEPTNTPPPATPQISKIEQAPASNTETAPGDLAEKARQDLAHRLGVSVDSVTVLAVIGQEFSTDAFYCRTTKERIAKEDSPQVVSGQSILLNASGHKYEYHASGQMVIFCRPLL